MLVCRNINVSMSLMFEFRCESVYFAMTCLFIVHFVSFLQGIVIKTPLQWPLYKGFSFSCWLRIENFPRTGMMGLFSFLTENGRGCWSALAKDRLFYEVKSCVWRRFVSQVSPCYYFLVVTLRIYKLFFPSKSVKLKTLPASASW